MTKDMHMRWPRPEIWFELTAAERVAWARLRYAFGKSCA